MFASNYPNFFLDFGVSSAADKRYNMQGMNKLLEKAKATYTAYNMVLCKYLYRNKSKDYFEDIINNKNFQMVPYMKDCGGDRYNPINAKLPGLFFYASVDPFSQTGQPQSFTFFGNTRFLVPVETMVNTNWMNLYFSDFFCLQNPSYHYTTLVLTRNQSSADNFCRKYLPQLSWYDNPFFAFDQFQRTFKVSGSHCCHVEILYTDVIDIADMMISGATIIHPMTTSGRGSSTPGGLKKNSLCSRCTFENREAHLRDVEEKVEIPQGTAPVRFPQLPTFRFNSLYSNREYTFDGNPAVGTHPIRPN